MNDKKPIIRSSKAQAINPPMSHRTIRPGLVACRGFLITIAEITTIEHAAITANGLAISFTILVHLSPYLDPKNVVERSCHGDCVRCWWLVGLEEFS